MGMTNPIRQRVLDYVASFGLDPSEISVDTSEEGFHLLRRSGADPDILHPWPEGFDYPHLELMLTVAALEDVRIANKQSHAVR